MNKKRHFGVEGEPVDIDSLPSESEPVAAGEAGDERRVEVTDPKQDAEGESPEMLRERLEQALEEVDTYRDQYLRAKAEMENIRRRSQKEVANTRKYAIESFLNEVLPVKESLDQASQVELDENAGEAVSQMAEGLALTLRQIDAAFTKFAVTEVLPEKGDLFDPELHQAMSMLPSDEVNPNEILTVVQKGYKLQDRLLRPAMVIVAKAPD